MKHPIIGLLALVSCLAIADAGGAQQAIRRERTPPLKSIYTDLSSSQCKTIESDEETGSSVQSCPGVGGYTLQVEDSDDRMSITVVTPNGEKHPLNYWDVMTPAFSTLGSKAEWRVVEQQGKTIPVALIVRVNASENPDSNKITSYLAVAKIAADGICVTDKINPTARANEEARKAADTSADKPCL